MKKYKIIALNRDGKSPEVLAPFIIVGRNKKEAYDNALYHIKNHLEIIGNFHLNINEV